MVRESKKGRIRKLKGGAYRDIDDGKFEYFGFTHPIIEHSFAGYMHEHRLMTNGELRDSNNWWTGFGKDVCIQSLARHMKDLESLKAGYFVYERRENGKAERIIRKKPFKVIQKNHKQITEEECCNAIRFNVGAYNLEVLKEKKGNL